MAINSHRGGYGSKNVDEGIVGEEKMIMTLQRKYGDKGTGVRNDEEDIMTRKRWRENGEKEAVMKEWRQ